jgi:hypothetical protein
MLVLKIAIIFAELVRVSRLYGYCVIDHKTIAAACSKQLV